MEIDPINSQKVAARLKDRLRTPPDRIVPPSSTPPSSPPVADPSPDIPNDIPPGSKLGYLHYLATTIDPVSYEEWSRAKHEETKPGGTNIWNENWLPEKWKSGNWFQRMLWKSKQRDIEDRARRRRYRW